jgi:lipid-binding SYLF domain-containing protein
LAKCLPVIIAGCNLLFFNCKKNYMKKSISVPVLKYGLLLLLLLTGVFADAQTSSKDKKLVSDSKVTKQEFKNTSVVIKNLFSSSYGYVIFPNVGKGGMGIGGAAGSGVVYEKGVAVGKARLTQLTVGAQLGGQVYKEVIFFESKADLDRFKENNFEFSAQVSAVAATAGVSANVTYKEGVMVFTQQRGGLMYEATVGGQKFNYTRF